MKSCCFLHQLFLSLCVIIGEIMKRYLLCALLMVTSFVAKPQTFRTMFSQPYERVTAEIVAGFNISDLMIKAGNSQGSVTPDFKQHPGFNVGVNVDVPLFEGFYLKPGVLFTTRGGNFKSVQDDEHYVKNVHSGYYLQVPVLVSFRLGDVGRAQFQLNVGPYFAAGLFGDSTHNTKSGRLEDTHTIKYFYKEITPLYHEGFAHRFDCGLSFAAAMLFVEHIYVGVQYDLGLYNIAKAPIQQDTFLNIKNGNFSVQVGYRF